MQVADAPVPESVQEPENVPVLLLVRAKVPVGVSAIPVAVSVIVSVQMEEEPVMTGVLQVMLAVVGRLLTVIEVVPELEVWVVSPT